MDRYIAWEQLNTDNTVGIYIIKSNEFIDPKLECIPIEGTNEWKYKKSGKIFTPMGR